MDRRNVRVLGFIAPGDPDTLIVPLKRSGPKGRFHMAKEVFDASRATHKPDALDVLELEDGIASLEARKAEIERKTFLVPGQKRKALDEVQQGLGRLRKALLTAREHVAYNGEQSAILEREREFRRKRDIEEQAGKPEAVKQQKLAAEIAKAKAGLPETEGKPEPAKPDKPDPMTAHAAMSPEQKQKLQADMLETPIPKEEDGFDSDDWLERRRLLMERKRKPKP
jgi:hypothetical protein